MATPDTPNGEDRLRSFADHLRTAASSVLLRRARPHRVKPSGPRHRQPISFFYFYNSDEQKRIAEAYIAQLDKAKVFPRPIVTQVVALKAFYPAEAYHQDYATRHPDNPYIVYNDAPKVAHLRQEFPDLYIGK